MIEYRLDEYKAEWEYLKEELESLMEERRILFEKVEYNEEDDNRIEKLDKIIPNKRYYVNKAFRKCMNHFEELSIDRRKNFK